MTIRRRFILPIAPALKAGLNEAKMSVSGYLRLDF